ncbi:MAG: serine hydrolase [Gemmatimonadota bacterium]|nr:MAG: serine hydrolase [Gemmatimonadota bacterium]
MRKIGFQLTAVLLGALGPLQIRGQDPATQIEQLVSQYHELRQFNGAVLVGQHGDVIYEGGFGYANMDWQIPNSPETKFRVGSVTKQFTATVILKLVEQGKLSLQGTIADYLADYPPEVGDQVTIHHLLTHSSGIPSYTGLPIFGELERDSFAPDSFVTVFSGLELEFEPGSTFRYNNSGYFLLGVIIERVTGMTYDDALRALVLDPLGLDDTGYDHHDSILERRATGYSKGLVAYSVADFLDMSLPFAAGSMYSTVRDLHAWDRSLYTDSVFESVDTKQLMFTPHIQNYGYGWGIQDVPLGADGAMIKLVAHGGGINGFVTGFWRLVDDGYVVIVMDNTEGSHVGDVQRGIVDILYGRKPGKPRRSIAEELVPVIDELGIAEGVQRYRELKSSRPDEFDFGEDELNTLGYYYLGLGIVETAIVVFELNVEAFPDASNTYDSLGEAYLVAGNRTKAIVNYRKSVELDPDNENGKAVLARLGVELGDVSGDVVVPIDVLQGYVGEYELGGDILVAITVEDGKLIGQASGQGKYELTPISQTEFAINGLELRITFVLDEDGEPTGLNLYRGGETLFGKKKKR